jgi:hypothetical protein
MENASAMLWPIKLDGQRFPFYGNHSLIDRKMGQNAANC